MITLGATIVASPILLKQQSALAGFQVDPINRKAPPAITGDNVYVAWWTNKTGNEEVIFRASTDVGKTFGDKINLSNSNRC